MSQNSHNPAGRVLLRRGGWIESVHRVHAVVTDERGQVVWSMGEPEWPTFFRSAAKPFQALPLVDDGVVDRFEMSDEELALCCASHNSEARHRSVAEALLHRVGLDRSALACGGHPPLRPEEGVRIADEGRRPDALDSNCSGKHAGMLALAVHHGWPTGDYHRPTHPVQERVTREVARWTGLPIDDLETGVDGCGVVCFRTPLDRISVAFARLAAASSADGAAGRVVGAMTRHPEMVAGVDRLDTAVMGATGGAVFAKVGAEGVYGAGMPATGWGLALKVEDGGWRAADVALVRILDALGLTEPSSDDAVAPFRRPTVYNTRGEDAGRLEADFGVAALVETARGE